MRLAGASIGSGVRRRGAVVNRPGSNAREPPFRNPGPPAAALPMSTAPMWRDGGDRAHSDSTDWLINLDLFDTCLHGSRHTCIMDCGQVGDHQRNAFCEDFPCNFGFAIRYVTKGVCLLHHRDHCSSPCELGGHRMADGMQTAGHSGCVGKIERINQIGDQATILRISKKLALRLLGVIRKLFAKDCPRPRHLPGNPDEKHGAAVFGIMHPCLAIFRRDLNSRHACLCGGGGRFIGFLSQTKSHVTQEQSGANCQSGNNHCPRVPQDHAPVDAWRHAWAHPVPQIAEPAHLTIPSWTGRQFATHTCPGEEPVSLSTVKPPRNRRTRLREEDQCT